MQRFDVLNAIPVLVLEEHVDIRKLIRDPIMISAREIPLMPWTTAAPAEVVAPGGRHRQETLFHFTKPLRNVITRQEERLAKLGATSSEALQAAKREYQQSSEWLIAVFSKGSFD
jgi:hypothetical protein